MFETLSDRLSGILDKLTRRGALSEADVGEAMREVRRALIEADVALDVVKSFTDKVRTRAVGHEVLRSVTPGQQVIKIVHDTLVDMLGSEAEPISLNAVAPVPIMMVGLQGSGKTTTTAKIARRLKERMNRKVLLASLDTRRPAAQEQLRVLGEANEIDTLPIVAGQSPTDIAARAMTAAKLGGYDVVILDTAGRTHVDEALMLEMADIKRIADPHEILLVADSLTGQDAVTVARAFDERVGVTGIVLTRMDGDGRGGAALSMRYVTGKPIKLLGVGEKADALEDFDPRRVAGRILGMGDIVGLVEKAAAEMDIKKAAEAAKKMQKGIFDLDDLAGQLQQMQRMGGMKGLMGMMPGMGKMKGQMDAAGIDDRFLKRQLAIISSMTKEERKKPELLAASRKRRVAAGSGTRVEDINRLLKQHRQMADMMKMMSKKKGGLLGGLGSLFGGGMPDMDPAALEEMAKSGQMPGGPGGAGGLPPMPGGMGGGLGGLPPMPPGGLGGLAKGLGLPGLPKGPLPPGFGKKK